MLKSLPETKGKSKFPSTKSILVALVFGAILAVFAYSLYLKREALLFAYSNDKQVLQAKESYLKELEKAQVNYASNLSRSFIAN